MQSHLSTGYVFSIWAQGFASSSYPGLSVVLKWLLLNICLSAELLKGSAESPLPDKTYCNKNLTPAGVDFIKHTKNLQNMQIAMHGVRS